VTLESRDAIACRAEHFVVNIAALIHAIGAPMPDAAGRKGSRELLCANLMQRRCLRR
jgi:hypothetical protein